ncbi:DUF1048 domain-containing protein [Clostridium senegalense]
MIDKVYKLSENLTKENDKIFTDIICYLRVSDLSECEQDEISNDILGMFLDWQGQGKSIDDVIGSDYKKFTDDIISAVNPKKSILEKLKEYLTIIIEGFCIMCTIDFLFLYLPKLVKGNLHLNYNYTLDILVKTALIILVCCVAINYIGKNSFTLSKKKVSKFSNFIFGCSISGLIIILILLSKILNNITIISINIFYIIAIIIIYWGYKGIKKLKPINIK